MRRLLVFALMLAVMSSVQAEGFSVPSHVQEITGSQRVIPSDPKLPKYDNPTEFDLEDGNLHISFKGVFRGIKDAEEFIGFMFVAVPKKDMYLNTGCSEMFDSKGTRFNDWGNPWIGRENTWGREIIADIPMLVSFWLRVRPSDAGQLPTIARVNFAFNDQGYQFRNIKVEDWPVWEGIRQELGL